MLKEIIEVLNEMSDKEINDFYTYMYGDCKRATCKDKRRHIYGYMRLYLKHHKYKNEFIDKYKIIKMWLDERELKCKN